MATCITCAQNVKLCGNGVTQEDCPGNDLVNFLGATLRDSDYDYAPWCWLDFIECGSCKTSIFMQCDDARCLRLYVPHKAWHNGLKCDCE